MTPRGSPERVEMGEPDWESRYREEEKIVARIWTLLGNPSYDALAGRSIYDLVLALQVKAAAHDDLVAALSATTGYMTNAVIDLQGRTPKQTTIDTLNGGIALARTALTHLQPAAGAA